MEDAKDVIPNLHKASCCSLGGLDAKIAPVLRESFGTDAYAETCARVEACLSAVARWLKEKGAELNRESEVELRSCTAISLKHPVKTVLAITLTAFSRGESFLVFLYFISRSNSLNVKSTLAREHTLYKMHVQFCYHIFRAYG